MGKYNFLNLSPAEFEELTRDLLQKKLDCFIESFKDGRDNGIDLRFAKVKGKSKIVQCKRYKDFQSLKGKFKDEVVKVKKLNPKEYYFVTSAGLSPQNKQFIFETFKPFIKSTEDILGADDLDNLLGIYPEVETKHYKLWLSSVNVLQKVLHSKIYNQSEFELEEIQDNLRFYVQNDSFYEALKIIQANNFVIISGIPGIGKTTLARILVYHFLGNGFDEFIFMGDSIDVGYMAFNKSAKQVFLFDDFLGSNFLETQKVKNEDSKIIKFIDRIRKSKNKILIFTTREYILNQAKLEYEKFKRSDLDNSKCIIDLSKYTKLVRAKILYNHLFFNNIPEDFINEIIKNNFYLQIISHRNYNPRIIETLVKSKIWNQIINHDIQKVLLSYFDNPQEVWKHAYEKHISNLSKLTLISIFSLGTPVLYEDLYVCVNKFILEFQNKYQVILNELSYKNSLKELENTFIRIGKDYFGKTYIEYQNPSILDFIKYYLSDNKQIVKDFLDTVNFFNQYPNFYTIFDDNDEELKSYLISQLKNNFSLSMSSYEHVNYTNYPQIVLRKRNDDLESKLKYLFRFDDITKRRIVKSLIEENTNELFLDDSRLNLYVDDYVKFVKFSKDFIKVSPNKLIERIAQKIYDYNDLIEFEEFKKVYPEEFDKFITCDFFIDKVLYYVAENEVDNIDKDDLDEARYRLEYLANTYDSNIWFQLSKIDDIEEQKREEDEEENNIYDHEAYLENKYRNTSPNYDNQIVDMFNSLKND